MKAIAIAPGTPGARLVDRPEPRIAAPDEVKVRVRGVGICGTDREQAEGGRARAPDGRDELVIGHEMFGEVVEVGPAVTRVAVGDAAVFTVRRGCGRCTPCGIGRSDMCRTGEFRERGIWGLDGFQAELVADREANVVRVPRALERMGVLCEPLSIVEKAIAAAVRVQEARLPDAAVAPDWLYGRRCLVAGLGPVGLLTAMVLRLRGAEVIGLDILDPDSARPRWLAGIGGTYVDGRSLPTGEGVRAIGPLEMIVEAAGVARLAFDLPAALGANGILVLTGIPGGSGPLEVAGAALVRRLVLANQVVLGSVNASRGHFQMAVDDLAQAHARWGDHLVALISHRLPYTDFADVLAGHVDGEIKSVLTWDD